MITYYLNTGCFLYPVEQTCLVENKWSIPINEVKELSIHYEWWAKAGGGPEFTSELNKIDYIENFNWLSNWIERHFFYKVFDTLAGTILICLIILISFYTCKKNKINLKNNISFFIYLILFIFLLEWFLNHPSMRYGGYVLFGLILIIFTSSILAKFNYDKIRIRKMTIIFICVSIIIFNYRNIIRIDKEIKIYNYDILKSPFFYTPEVKTKKIIDNKDFKIYHPINNSCWAAKTPCSYNSKLVSDKFLWMNMIYRK